MSYLTSVGPRSTKAGDLRQIEIFHNEFLNNDAGDAWIAELGPNLSVLNYGSTSFKGPLPKLPSGIVEFDCSNTLHSGRIPEEVFQGLQSLKVLIMDGIDFQSTVPTSIAALPSLEILYIRETGLQGDLSYMQDMTAIVEHLVDGNPRLTGTIPSFLGDLITLQSFSAADCGLVCTYCSGGSSYVMSLTLFLSVTRRVPCQPSLGS